MTQHAHKDRDFAILIDALSAHGCWMDRMIFPCEGADDVAAINRLIETCPAFVFALCCRGIRFKSFKSLLHRRIANRRFGQGAQMPPEQTPATVKPVNPITRCIVSFFLPPAGSPADYIFEYLDFTGHLACQVNHQETEISRKIET